MLERIPDHKPPVPFRPNSPRPRFQVTKERLQTFSDGVIAIIITIMILNIPLPEAFDRRSIMNLLGSILVYFVSFIVVGSQWSKHHVLLEATNAVSRRTLWRTLFFLFFVSLIPIFTQWMMENPDEIAPALGYDIVLFW